tara:strand:+ start:75528 stop:76403 length:876 start_codon:yes stop_codon:yes gene_type:complete
MIQGSLVALVTPMLSDGSIDYELLKNLIEWHIDKGTDAIVSVGTTGESATLNEKEHCETIKKTVEFAAKRIPVIAGTGANSTDEAINLTKCAESVGADACLLVTPYYNKPTQKGLYLHHKAVANAVKIPQILYNVPGRTAVDMLPETIGELSKIENIVGVKEATGDISRIIEIRKLTSKEFAIYSGDDATAKEAIFSGANGDISVTANVAPDLMHSMCHAALNGDLDRANKINANLDILHNDLFLEANPIPVKYALYSMGLIKNGIRLPLTWLSEDYHQIIDKALSNTGIK